MKIAGRKNDGAWYRTNKVISTLSSSEASDLKTEMLLMTTMSDYQQAIQELAGTAGISPDNPSYPASADMLADVYSTKGIPRQSWYGNWSYDTYTKSGTAPNFVYTKDHWLIAQSFGEEIRKLMKRFLMGRRALKDLVNTEVRAAGNPGGLADGTEGN